MKKFLLLFGLIALASIVLASQWFVITDKSVYGRGEEVRITLTNFSGENMPMFSTAPWEIRAAGSDKLIYRPVAGQIVWELLPGDSHTWVWPQAMEEGELVRPGKYYVLFPQNVLASQFFHIRGN